jgi:hypothetical protein
MVAGADLRLLVLICGLFKPPVIYARQHQPVTRFARQSGMHHAAIIQNPAQTAQLFFNHSKTLS